MEAHVIDKKLTVLSDSNIGKHTQGIGRAPAVAFVQRTARVDD
jgi:hypothetical protein